MLTSYTTLGPLPGILADKYFGRPKVLSFSFLLCFLGSCVQSLFHTLFELDIHGIYIDRGLYYTIHFPVVIILILGSSGVAALLLPYGVDQMEEAGEGIMKPYFYWFFWFINFGSLLSFGHYLAYTPKDSFYLLSSSYLATIASFLAVVTFKFSRSFDVLHRGPNIGTPLRKIYNVTKSSLRIFYYRRDEINEYESIALLDYAKLQHYGRARFEDVEDVKTFYRIVIVLASLFGYFSLYHLQTHMYILQAEELIRDTSSYSSSLAIGLTDSFIVILVVPFVLLISRSSRFYFFKILYRVELGICLALLSVLCANVVGISMYLRGDADKQCVHLGEPTANCLMTVLLLAMLPQTVLMSLSQIFAIVGAYEFVYAQSPGDMKGFTFGILNTVNGVNSYTPTLVRYIMLAASHCPQTHNQTLQCSSCTVADKYCYFYKNNDFVYFLLFALFALFYTFYFLFVAMKYKRRERQQIERWYCN